MLRFAKIMHLASHHLATEHVPKQFREAEKTKKTRAVESAVVVQGLNCLKDVNRWVGGGMV